MKDVLIEVLITMVYYVLAYFLPTYAFESFPSNGGPSEAFFLFLGFILLSIIIFIYSIVQLMKDDTSKIGSIITHIIAMQVLIRLLM